MAYLYTETIYGKHCTCQECGVEKRSMIALENTFEDADGWGVDYLHVFICFDCLRELADSFAAAEG